MVVELGVVVVAAPAAVAVAVAVVAVVVVVVVVGGSTQYAVRSTGGSSTSHTRSSTSQDQYENCD